MMDVSGIGRLGRRRMSGYGGRSRRFRDGTLGHPLSHAGSRARARFLEQRGGVHGPHDHAGDHCLYKSEQDIFRFWGRRGGRMRGVDCDECGVYKVRTECTLHSTFGRPAPPLSSRVFASFLVCFLSFFFYYAHSRSEPIYFIPVGLTYIH